MCRQLFQSLCQSPVGGEQHGGKQFVVAADSGQSGFPFNSLPGIQFIDPFLKCGLEKMAALRQSLRSENPNTLLLYLFEGAPAHGQTCRRFFLFIDQQAVEIDSGLGQQVQVIVHIPGSAEGIFRQQNGKLTLHAGGRGQQFVIIGVGLQRQRIFQGEGQKFPGICILGTQAPVGQSRPEIDLLLQICKRGFSVSRHIARQYGFIVLNTKIPGVSHGIVHVQSVMYHFLPEQFLGGLPEFLLVAVRAGQKQGQPGEEQQQPGACQKLPPGEFLMFFQGRLREAGIGVLYAPGIVRYAA